MKKNTFLLLLFVFCVWTVNVHAFEFEKVDIHGFVSQGYLKSDENNYLADTEDGTFQFNELGINFTSNLTEDLRLGIQFFSRDLGDVGNNEVTVDWAFADYRWKSWLGLRAGKIKAPIGFYNEARDIDAVRTSILLPQSVYYEIYRDNMNALQGAGIYGDMLHDVMGNLSYQLLYGTMNIDRDSGAAKLVESRGFLEVTEFDADEIMVAALKWETPLEGLLVGGSYLKADVDIKAVTTIPLELIPGSDPIPPGLPMTMETLNYEMKIFSVEYIWQNLTLSSEYLTAASESRVVSNSMVVFPKTETDSEGYYISASYRFTDWLEAGYYYSEYYPDKDDKDGDNVEPGKPDHSAWSKDHALTLRFNINENWTIKLEGHALNGTAQIISSDNPDGTEEDWFLFGSKVTFSF